MTVWFTGDQHLGHANIIKHCQRPFENVREMDTVILDNLRICKRGDTLYSLGDLSLKSMFALAFLSRLEAWGVKLIYIRGNHDKAVTKELRRQNIPVHDLLNISINGQDIVLCHYAMRVWHKSHYNSWQLYGHSHGFLPPEGKQWDVGVDNNGFRPMSFEEIAEIMQTRPDNFNLVENDRASSTPQAE